MQGERHRWPPTASMAARSSAYRSRVQHSEVTRAGAGRKSIFSAAVSPSAGARPRWGWSQMDVATSSVIQLPIFVEQFQSHSASVRCVAYSRSFLSNTIFPLTKKHCTRGTDDNRLLALDFPWKSWTNSICIFMFGTSKYPVSHPGGIDRSFLHRPLPP